jgi:hypothetical protein
VGIPLLDLVEALEKGNRDEDGNGLLAVADLDLWEKLSAVFDVRYSILNRLSVLRNRPFHTIVTTLKTQSKRD